MAAAALVDGFTAREALAVALSAVGVGIALTVEVPANPADVLGRVRNWLGILVGMVLFLSAIALTDGVTSPFVILPLASIILAAVAGGIHMAGPVTLIAVAGIVVASGADVGTESAAFIRLSAIYLITAIAFSEVQRALLSETERADDLALASDAATVRRERLEAAHELLEDLLGVATSPELNAVATAQDAVRDVGFILPGAAVRISTIEGVTLARRGEPRDVVPTTSLPIPSTGEPSATLCIWSDEALSSAQLMAVSHTTDALGIALENDAMVQRLAGVAIQRERVRLARELHDDVAPTIASVGLALDMVLLGPEMAPEQSATLDATRSNVTRLVDQIRNRVQDLRADRSVSIVELASRLVADVDTDGPTVSIEIEERTPPRPAVAHEVGSLITEAFRNAVAHADASQVTIRGKIDANEGRVSVIDDGRGFDPEELSDRRFGLIGMRERASLVGASLAIESSPGHGAAVHVTWKEQT